MCVMCIFYTLQFWIYCAIIIEGAWALRICSEYQPIVADDPIPCVVKDEKYPSILGI